MKTLTLPIPPELVEAIARRSAELVLERIGEAAARPELLTPEQAAEFLCCDVQRIYDLCSDGRLHRYKDGARLLISRSELEEYVGLQHGSNERRQRLRLA